MADVFNIAGRIHSTSNEQIVTTTNELYDSDINDYQHNINASYGQRIGAIQDGKFVNVASLSDVSDPDIETIYRVAGTDTYSEYAWNGSTFILLDTKSNNGIIDGGRADTVYTVGENIDCGGAASI